MVRGQDCDLDHNEGDLRYNRTGNHLDRLTLYPKSGKEAGWRELIRSRTGEGRSRAKARGVRFGRPPKLTTHQRQEAFQRLANGETQAGYRAYLCCSSGDHRRMLGTAGSPFDGASVAGT
jgi:DNA invertase Pin-like site-specific DNA recombinase